MRALICRELDGTLHAEDVPDPIPAPGQLLIDIEACGVNFADTLITKGRYQEKPVLPFSPGFEVAGTVSGLGADVSGFEIGQRVLGTVPHGGYAQKVTAPANGFLPIPDGMSSELAASLPIAYGTSHIALADRARLTAGNVLVVHAAASGVGLTAVEVGKRLGATVIATAGGAEKLAVAKAHGADHLIDYKAEDVRTRIKELTGGEGADVIYDPVGGEIFDASLRAVRPGARILLIGFASGTVPQIPANIALVKNVTCIGFYYGGWVARYPESNAACFRDVFDWWQKGLISPRIDAAIPFEQAEDALTKIRNRSVKGKIVLTMGTRP